jgi:hypothetical protein
MSFLPALLTGTRSRNDAASALPRFQGLDGGPANHDSRSAQAPAGDFDFPFRLKPPTVAPSPNPSGSCSVSSAPPRIAFQRVKGARRTFSARAPPNLSPETFIAKAQLHFSGLSQTRSKRGVGKPPAYRQARLNSRNPINIATACTHRQPWLVASDGTGGFFQQLTGFSNFWMDGFSDFLNSTIVKFENWTIIECGTAARMSNARSFTL